MKKSVFLRVVILGLLIAGLAIPPEGLRALAQDAGPIKPSPGQQQGGAPPPQQGQPQKKPEYSISVKSTAVNVDVVVADQDGNLLTGLKKQNFRVLDDGKPQLVTNFAPTDAPITIVILMEFSSIGYGFFAYNARYWSYEFLNHLNPKDWVALVTYDLKPRVEVDFTQNKSEVGSAISSLYFPGFHEANLFDALLDTLDRLKDVQGKKSILLMATGFDTFSKHTLDQTLKALKNTDVSIFCVGVAEQILVRYNTGVGYLQAKNQLDNFAKLTGGYAWFPRFDGELPDIFNSVTAFLRNQYSLAFVPADAPPDGKYHKLKIEVVGDDGNPLTVTNKKGKPRKVIVYAREGYTAPKGEVGD